MHTDGWPFCLLPADVDVPEELVVYDDIEDVYTYGSLQVRAAAMT
jgi:hypothetical protein